jgi:hypothetical protein
VAQNIQAPVLPTDAFLARKVSLPSTQYCAGSSLGTYVLQVYLISMELAGLVPG